MTTKNGADFVQFVMQAQAPASQIGQSRALSLRSRRQHKARGGAEGGTPGQVRSDIKPVKRAAAVAHFVGCGSLYYHFPGAYAPGFMLPPAPRAWKNTKNLDSRVFKV